MKNPTKRKEKIMEACLWDYLDLCVCNGNKCKKFLSVNADPGKKIADEYVVEIERALKEVNDKYKDLLERWPSI